MATPTPTPTAAAGREGGASAGPGVERGDAGLGFAPECCRAAERAAVWRLHRGPVATRVVKAVREAHVVVYQAAARCREAEGRHHEEAEERGEGEAAAAHPALRSPLFCSRRRSGGGSARVR